MSSKGNARRWQERGRRFWESRQRLAKPGALTGYLLDESPPSIGRHRFEGEWAELREWIRTEVPERGRALDVGCGTGAWLKVLADEFRTVEGWDYAPAMVAASCRTLKEAGVRGAVLRCGEITRRRGKAEFDFIFVGGVLMYTPEAALGPLLRALRRLLKPGGLLVLRESTRRGATWAREGLALRPGLLANAKQRKGADYVAIYRSRETLVEALAVAGFKAPRLRANIHYKLSDLTEDWLRRLKVTPERAETAAMRLYRWRKVLLYPEYYLRRWNLENTWLLARTSSTWKER